MISGRVIRREGERAWPVLLLLFAAVLIPTACVLWFLNEAVKNQRDVVRQKLSDAYRSQLALLRDTLESHWRERLAGLDSNPRNSAGPVHFEHLVQSGAADSFVILAPDRRLVYPAPPLPPETDVAASLASWRQARALEDSRDLLRAAEAYGHIARGATGPDLRARAIQAQTRCLLQSGAKSRAIDLAVGHFTRAGMRHGSDLQGRLVAGDALLMSLQLMRGTGDARISSAARRLGELLRDYTNTMPGGQRFFLMKELAGLNLHQGETGVLPTFAAEEIASRFLGAEPASSADGVLRLSAIPGIWKAGSPSGQVIALYRTETIASESRRLLTRQSLPPGVEIDIGSPGSHRDPGNAIASAAAGPALPGWQLTLSLAGPKPFDELLERQMATYLWIAALAISAVAAVVFLAGRAIRRQMRIANLKADLLATVSHELKTPLASMRLLVDTLLDDTSLDPGKTRDYLQLISSENSRLSRLIENFLTFSRMERNRHPIELRYTGAAEVVQATMDAAGERFTGPECRLTVDIEPGLPPLRADADALVTVLLNLLDNAYKYSSGTKAIRLRVYGRDAHVCFELQDNGIGMPPRETKKIFRKFYQVDRQLSRGAGGVGMGLSIVEYIVRAHGGTIHVKSEPGAGSTFTVMLPLERTGELVRT